VKQLYNVTDFSQCPESMVGKHCMGEMCAVSSAWQHSFEDHVRQIPSFSHFFVLQVTKCFVVASERGCFCNINIAWNCFGWNTMFCFLFIQCQHNLGINSKTGCFYC